MVLSPAAPAAPAAPAQPVLRAATPADAAAPAMLAVQVFLDTCATQGVRADLAEEALAEYSVAAFARRLG